MNQTAAAFIKAKEALRLTAYRDSGGVWTIGWGHTGPEVKEGLVWTLEQAEDAFRRDFLVFEKSVRDKIKVPLSEASEAACISLAYNIGVTAFAESTLLRTLNSGDYLGAAIQFPRWCMDNGKRVRGLLVRRLEEALMFTKGLRP